MKIAMAIAVSCVGLLLPASPLQAQFAATYNFVTGATETPTVTHVLFGPLAATQVVLAFSTTNGNITMSGWVTNGGAADTTEYLSFTLAPASGYTLDITSVTFKESRSLTGPANIAVGLFVNGSLQETSSTMATTVAASTATSSMTTRTFDFVDKSGLSSTETAEFRIYGWAGTSTAGTLRLDELTVYGAVQATVIPEPACTALIVACCGAALGFSKCRRRLSERAPD